MLASYLTAVQISRLVKLHEQSKNPISLIKQSYAESPTA